MMLVGGGGAPKTLHKSEHSKFEKFSIVNFKSLIGVLPIKMSLVNAITTSQRKQTRAHNFTRHNTRKGSESPNQHGRSQNTNAQGNECPTNGIHEHLTKGSKPPKTSTIARTTKTHAEIAHPRLTGACGNQSHFRFRSTKRVGRAQVLWPTYLQAGIPSDKTVASAPVRRRETFQLERIIVGTKLADPWAWCVDPGGRGRCQKEQPPRLIVKF